MTKVKWRESTTYHPFPVITNLNDKVIRLFAIFFNNFHSNASHQCATGRGSQIMFASCCLGLTMQSALLCLYQDVISCGFILPEKFMKGGNQLIFLNIFVHF